MSFAEWMRRLNEEILDLTDGEIEYEDLPDLVDVTGLYEDGVSPADAAEEVLSEAGF
jgi:hypothetical protein